MHTALLLLLAADLTGRWSGKLDLPKSPPLYVELKQAGDRLTGYAGLRADFMTELTNANLSGRKLSFDMRMPMGPFGHFDGALEGGKIVGIVSFSGAAEKPRFELTRSGNLTRLPPTFPPAETGGLEALSDEFDAAENLAKWKNLSLEESLPNRFARADVNKTKPGSLFVELQSGAWWAGFHGGYLFREITGDFAVTTRIKVTGKSGGEPQNIWTISGLLVRAPGEITKPLALRKENWLYLMTGRGPRESRVVDSKSTVDSVNQWDILPAEANWYELRIVRVGPLFVSFIRPDGGAWTIRKRMLRPDLPATLQVGLNFTCDFQTSATMPAAEYNARLYPGKSKCDSETVVDYVRFSRAGGADSRAALAGKEEIDLTDELLFRLFRP